jgi:hypothetical protein
MYVPVAEKDHNLIRDEARELLRQIEEKSVEYDPERRVCNILHHYLYSNWSFFSCSSPWFSSTYPVA